MKTKNTYNAQVPRSRVRAALELYADSAAKTMEGYGKDNAPWTDITSNARNSIQGSRAWAGDTLFIVLSGNMEYFIFLELAHEKRWAILKPTIDKHATAIFAGYRKLVKK